MAASFPIQTVAERTGLTPHVIRAWERRYRAIEPERSAGKHRLYSEA
jgi:DNA-binding transcriptional MerR regulator